jgi:MurNAc alpha-1-phosphate uridylyltransferase
MKAMILAAGRGERLRPLTDTRPKSIVDVGGKTLLERHLEHIQAAGIKTVVINLGWLGEQIADRIGNGKELGLDVIYSLEGDNILETGGGIFKALPRLGTAPFLVINADIFTDMPVPRITLRDDVLGHLVLVPTPAYRAHGDFDIEDGLIRRSEKPAYTFSGVAVYRPEFFARCTSGRFSLAPMFFHAADRGRLSGSLYEGPWADIGTPERLEAVRKSL